MNKVPRGDKEAVLEARKRELEFTTTYIENAVIKQKQVTIEVYIPNWFSSKQVTIRQIKLANS